MIALLSLSAKEPRNHRPLRHLTGLLLVALCAVPAVHAQERNYDEAGSGPIRLRQEATPSTGNAAQQRAREEELRRRYDSDAEFDRGRDRGRDRDVNLDRRPDALLERDRYGNLLDAFGMRSRFEPRGEFVEFVQKLAGPQVEIRRYGSEMVTRTEDRDSVDFNPLVPPEYLVKPGDELLLTMWGSIDADLRLVVDRAGRIVVPRVGTIQVAGVRYSDLPDTVSKRVARVFRNFQLSISLGQLRGVRVYVTGFVDRPGAYSVNSLSTLTQALMAADGPSAAGSFRNIELRRAGKLESKFDLYDLLLQGDRAADRIVQADDVVHVHAVGPQVALIGSVNQPAVFELQPGETVTDLLQMAGGFSTVADRSRLAIERLDDRKDVRIAQLALPAELTATLGGGDVVRAFSAVDLTLPLQRQNKRVRLEGEVMQPGEYVLPPGSTMADALAAAGGLTSEAYVFGTEFNRESVRLTQQENYQRALRDLEVNFAKTATSQRVASADEAAAQTARQASTERLVERLRSLRPTGRVVLQVTPETTHLPNVALEQGDRIYVPPRSTTVGVFGSVYNASSYWWNEGRNAGEYLQLAGGPTITADERSVFIIRANGSVVSGRQHSGWFRSGGGLEGVKAEAGDTIFMPDEVNRTTLTQDFKDWTQIVYQLGLGVAAVIAVGR